MDDSLFISVFSSNEETREYYKTILLDLYQQEGFIWDLISRIHNFDSVVEKSKSLVLLDVVKRKCSENNLTLDQKEFLFSELLKKYFFIHNNNKIHILECLRVIFAYKSIDFAEYIIQIVNDCVELGDRYVITYRIVYEWLFFHSINRSFFDDRITGIIKMIMHMIHTVLVENTADLWYWEFSAIASDVISCLVIVPSIILDSEIVMMNFCLLNSNVCNDSCSNVFVIAFLDLCIALEPLVSDINDINDLIINSLNSIVSRQIKSSHICFLSAKLLYILLKNRIYLHDLFTNEDFLVKILEYGVLEDDEIQNIYLIPEQFIAFNYTIEDPKTMVTTRHVLFNIIQEIFLQDYTESQDQILHFSQCECDSFIEKEMKMFCIYCYSQFFRDNIQVLYYIVNLLEFNDCPYVQVSCIATLAQLEIENQKIKEISLKIFLESEVMCIKLMSLFCFHHSFLQSPTLSENELILMIDNILNFAKSISHPLPGLLIDLLSIKFTSYFLETSSKFFEFFVEFLYSLDSNEYAHNVLQCAIRIVNILPIDQISVLDSVDSVFKLCANHFNLAESQYDTSLYYLIQYYSEKVSNVPNSIESILESFFTIIFDKNDFYQIDNIIETFIYLIKNKSFFHNEDLMGIIFCFCDRFIEVCDNSNYIQTIVFLFTAIEQTYCSNKYSETLGITINQVLSMYADDNIIVSSVLLYYMSLLYYNNADDIHIIQEILIHISLYFKWDVNYEKFAIICLERISEKNDELCLIKEHYMKRLDNGDYEEEQYEEIYLFHCSLPSNDLIMK